MMMMKRMVVAEWQDRAGGSSNDSGGLSDLKVSRTDAAAAARLWKDRYETAALPCSFENDPKLLVFSDSMLRLVGGKMAQYVGSF